MFVSTLESLVLRGVSVRCDGKTVGLRLGKGYQANPQTPETISMRHPSPGCDQGFNLPAGWPDHADEDRVAGATGAGRSRSRAGVLGRRSPARSAGRAIHLGWPHHTGGPKSTAAARLCRIPPARLVASVGEADSGRPATATAQPPASGLLAAKAGSSARAGSGRWKPATRTPPASTRGKGVGRHGNSPF